MVETEEEQKHPFVTCKNAETHRFFSATMTLMSLIQIILAIVISEKVVHGNVYSLENNYNEGDSRDYREYYYTDYPGIFYGDHMWVGFVGLVLAALGFSVWHTRARANGIMLSIMLFISGFLIYPLAAGLAAVKRDELTRNRDTWGLQTGSFIYTGVQALFIMVWAFYASLHTCCNSKVKKRTQLNIQGGDMGALGRLLQQQQNVVYVQQPMQYATAPQGVQFAPNQQGVQFAPNQQGVQFAPNQQGVQYAPNQQGVQFANAPQQGVQYVTASQQQYAAFPQQGVQYGQPVQYVTGQPPQPQYVTGQPPQYGPVTYMVAEAPPQYNTPVQQTPVLVQQAPVPVQHGLEQVQHGLEQVQHGLEQVQHGELSGTAPESPPLYTES